MDVLKYLITFVMVIMAIMNWFGLSFLSALFICL